MIQFFQKLKAKKGFTLVELIVVIAIIGVLAAILIPTMLGYVTNSRVTSADSTASSIAKEIDSFLTSCDTAGYGMKKGSTYATGTINVDDGKWKVKLSDVSGFTAKGATWSTTESGAYNSSNVKSDASGKGEDLMAIQLAGLFPDVKNATVAFALSGGKCIAIAYSTDDIIGATASGITFPIETAFDIKAPDGSTVKVVNATSYAWDGNTAGVESTGEIIGTSPKLSVDIGGEA